MSNLFSTGCRQRGFSLLEVLVAFAVFSLSLGVLFQIFSSGLRGVDLARSYSHAVIVAESQLAEASADDVLEAGIREGIEDDRYRWITTVSKYDSADRDPQPGVPEAYRISVRVIWEDSAGREITLSTLRLAGAPE